MSGNLVRGFAVASATAVTTVGAVTGVAQSSTHQSADTETTAGDSTLLADLPMGQQAQIQSASLTQQADSQAIAADNSARRTAAETAREQAAKDAIAKQKAAQQKAAQQKALQEAKERQESQQKTDTSSANSFSLAPQSSYTAADAKAIARQMMSGDQFQCFSNIVDHESGWNYKAVNPTSGAYGLVQAYPASKMASAGSDWQTNPATQIKWGLNYMNGRYGSPCEAWTFWQANGSY